MTKGVARRRREALPHYAYSGHAGVLAASHQEEPSGQGRRCGRSMAIGKSPARRWRPGRPWCSHAIAQARRTVRCGFESDSDAGGRPDACQSSDLTICLEASAAAALPGRSSTVASVSASPRAMKLTGWRSGAVIQRSQVRSSSGVRSGVGPDALAIPARLDWETQAQHDQPAVIRRWPYTPRFPEIWHWPQLRLR